MIKLSVIVPGYNVEKYIAKCIESIVDNKITGMEIILVNDGSKDNTLEIMNTYKEKYPKLIKVIDQKNKGLSMARNAGMDIAKGEYITFVDSDDSIEPNMYKTMYQKAKEKDFDIVACGVNIIYPDKTVRISAGFDRDCTTKKAVKEIMNRWYTVVWNKIYKREFIKDFRFKENVWYEDVEFLYRIIPNVKSVGVVDDYFCNYMQREGSITYTYNEKLYQLIDNLNGVLEYYKKQKFYKQYCEELEYAYVRYVYATFIKRLAKCKDKEMYLKGIQRAQAEVQEKFPNYRNNKYLKGYSFKNIYLKMFSKPIAMLGFYVERNKLN